MLPDEAAPERNCGAGDLLGVSEALTAVREQVARWGPLPLTVLIVGESGVGKEVIARAVHQFSRRSGKPWVDINVAAFPEHLVESELFGYDKGAFSGADSAKPGLFELATGGTLLLDEVGELDPKMQVKLLRVLDGVPYYRLGGTKKIKVDVRIVASTNRNLEASIRDGKFRSDLFHRLNHVRIEVPPLRERREEVVPLAEFFLHNHDPGLSLSKEAKDALQRYSAPYWPAAPPSAWKICRRRSGAVPVSRNRDGHTVWTLWSSRPSTRSCH